MPNLAESDVSDENRGSMLLLVSCFFDSLAHTLAHPCGARRGAPVQNASKPSAFLWLRYVLLNFFFCFTQRAQRTRRFFESNAENADFLTIFDSLAHTLAHPYGARRCAPVQNASNPSAFLWLYIVF